jgi:hypothetical protein
VRHHGDYGVTVNTGACGALNSGSIPDSRPKTRYNIPIMLGVVVFLSFLTPLLARADGGLNNTPAVSLGTLFIIVGPVIFLLIHLGVIALVGKSRETQEQVSNSQDFIGKIILFFIDLILAILSAVAIIYLHIYAIWTLSGMPLFVLAALLAIPLLGCFFTKNPTRRKWWLHNLLFLILVTVFVTGYFASIVPILDMTSCSVNISVLSEEKDRVSSLTNECLYGAIDVNKSKEAIEKGYSSASFVPCDNLPNPQTNGLAEGTRGYCKMMVVSKLMSSNDKRLCTLQEYNIEKYAGYDELCRN